MGDADTPCPTTYGDEHKRGLAERANKMNSSAFHSNSLQRRDKQLSGGPECLR